MTNEELRKIANDLKFNRGCIHSNPRLMIEESFISGYKYALENQWISVKDRLPKNKDIVMVATINNCFMTAY